MQKVIRDNKVAVLISHGFGAGWYTWNRDHEVLLFHPKLVEMVENNKQDDITEEWVEENLGIKDVSCNGATDLVIHWIPVGTKFYIEEHDGDETLIDKDYRYLTA